ncbi:Ribulose-phosphate 3-epimerase [Candidatus Trichorickettsia mobilis]|uniref:Ribulose-phosphate 3-epimerase n=1 Tax=Candidatus Trichorickettsia mobilis TaxID=1346319 RepID=A0ABZ0USF5_9RICK|nr:ribulose-phosphate 3-epimerase [Candidatus Trichorickettsia mobilis]WPY00965.1 Ribulose-phosphate 3-epimerase [Candidatus Trichorickettsia mobilis]
MIQVSASILSADFAKLEQEIKAVERAGVDMIHIDVMDGHFVPNLTFGTLILETIRKLTKLPLDVHLMISQPELFIENYANYGADIITIHPESTIHLDRTLSTIRQCGLKAGIALLPSTLPDIIDYVIDKIDLILVMTVNPGFAGQQFLETQLPKIRILSKKIKHLNKGIRISVDGGINATTAANCVEAGASILVSGSFIFGERQEELKNRINQLQKLNLGD